MEDSKTLVSFLASTELFAHVDKSVFVLLEKDIKLIHLEKDEILMQHGEVADCFYIVITGTLQVLFKDLHGNFIFTDTIGSGQCVGELAFFTDGKRSATVHALEPCRLIRLSHTQFKILAAHHPPALIELYQLVSHRLRQTQLRLALYATNLFADLDIAVLQDLEREMWLVSLASGQLLFHEGDASDALYMVVSGRLRAATNHGTVELGRGEVVGELGLLTDGKRGATVYAIRDTLLARLSHEGFNRLMQKHPQPMMKQFVATSVRRLMQQLNDNLPPASNIITLAVVPLAFDVPLTEFTTRLVEALTPYGATLHLNSARFNLLVGHETAAQTPEGYPYNFNIVRWLSEQELNYRYVIYETDLVASLWSYRCLRQADHVLLVANSTTPPTLGHIELTLAKHDNNLSAKQSLVLLHPNGERLPTGTEKWLALHPKLDQHFHVRWNTSNDFGRLARFLVGRPVGLVLGGGGVRGFAHIGVIRALNEAQIPIDIVGGSSIGSIIAAQYAFGLSVDKMRQANQGLIDYSVIDFTLPFVSLVSTRQWTHVVQSIFGEQVMENLWLPYFCISSNLTTAEKIVQTTGVVWQSLRASCGFPGFTPPVNYNGDYLVDGGVLDNLPIETMRAYCGRKGIVIAVDVSPPLEWENAVSHGATLSGWEVLWRKINPLAQPLNIPNIVSLLYRAGTLASTRHLKEVIKQGVADLYLKLPVAHYGLMEVKSVDALIELGYLFTKQQVVIWQEAQTKVEEGLHGVKIV